MFHALFCKKFLSALSKKRRPRCHFLHASMKARNGRRAASRVINRSAFPLLTALPMCFTRAAIRLLRANTLSFCHLPRRFSITMEPHCALKAAGHLFKNKGCYHHNANDRFGLKEKFNSSSLGVFYCSISSKCWKSLHEVQSPPHSKPASVKRRKQRSWWSIL